MSVVIPTRAGWPNFGLSLDAVLPQVRALGGQLVIADASGLPAPDWAADADVEWIEMPGVPGYELRQAAYGRATGEIVAITEDHCAPSPDWLASVMEEHRRDPDAAAIYGMVENGSRKHSVDWALYGAGYLPWAPPRPRAHGNPGHANLTFKSWAFERVAPKGDQVLEFRYVSALRAAGCKVVASDRLLVTHVQCASIRTTGLLFFHDGRAIAGLRRQHMSALDWVRTALPPVIAGYRTLRTLATARSKPAVAMQVVRSAPLIAVLHLCHTIGETVGYLGGPGDSGSRLH
ncbi:MAG: glycosyltransferase family 2 protein [Chloroflexota bacterium]